LSSQLPQADEATYGLPVFRIPEIKVLDFLRSLKIAADVSHLSEGAAALVLPNFLSGRAKSGVVTRLIQIPESIPEYQAVVQWLLRRFGKGSNPV
jgi:hypothetical protein